MTMIFGGSNMNKIRVSVGTAVMLGLDRVRSNIRIETAYLLTYHNGRCRANCQFCAQARESGASPDRVARGVYPPYPLDKTIKGLRSAVDNGAIKRVCIQTINYPKMFEDLVEIVKLIPNKVPITISRHPMSYRELNQLFELGVDRVTIPLDTVTEALFDRIKGVKVGNPYKWKDYWEGLKRAIEVFGKGRVGTHIIIGLGEKEEEAIKTMHKLYEIGVLSGLFAFVPIRGTPLGGLPRPAVASYRRIQLAYYLIRNGVSDLSDFIFEDRKLIDVDIEKGRLLEIIETGKPFITVGCPNCNRPYSTEGPLGPIYNYADSPTKADIIEIKKQLEIGN
jgi:biotin synthase